MTNALLDNKIINNYRANEIHLTPYNLIDTRRESYCILDIATARESSEEMAIPRGVYESCCKLYQQ